jgi:hypothetical protein
MGVAVDPGTLRDPNALRSLMKNASDRGRPDIVMKCQVQLARLAGEKYSTAIEREFSSAVAAAEEIATATNRRTTRLSRTRQKEKRVGVKQCLIDWAVSPAVTQGFAMLVKGGHPELTGEAIVVRHKSEFGDDVVASAREKLKIHGVDPDQL